MNFISEPLKTYKESHTRLNNYVKISTSAVNFLYNSETDNKKLSEKINKLILDAGERWTPTIIKDPQAELVQLKNDLSKTGIIWVYSSFDVFFKQIEGQLSGHFPEIVKKTMEDNNEDDEKKEAKIIELYKKIGWELDNINNLLPILKFYETLRHCVAHNRGLPTKNLFEQSTSESFTNAIKSWKTKFKEKAISPPPIITDKVIELNPHHSIIYSETCLRIATDINKRLFKKLGLNHYIGKTIKRHLLDCSVLTKPACENYQRYIAYHLKLDYNIEITPYSNIFEYYSDEDEKKRDKKRYHTLKNN